MTTESCAACGATIAGDANAVTLSRIRFRCTFCRPCYEAKKKAAGIFTPDTGMVAAHSMADALGMVRLALGMPEFPDVRLVSRKAGATYIGKTCEGCGMVFGRDSRIVVEKHRGNFMEDGWKLYHRVCHPSTVDANLEGFVAKLDRQIAALTD